MAVEDNQWRTASFRQNIVNTIDEAIQQAGMPNARSGREMETHVFEKAKTREEYLNFVARLILHVRELRSGIGQGGGGGQGGQQQANATTLLQTLNQRPGMQRLGMGPNVQGQPIPGQMQGQMGNQMGQMAAQMGAQMNQMGGQMGQMGGPMGGQMGGQMQRQMGNQMQGPMGPMSGQIGGQMSQMGGQLGMSNQMGNQMQGQMGGPMSGQMVGQMGSQMTNQMTNQMQMNGQMPAQMQMNGQMPGQMPGQMGNQMASQLGGPSGQMTGQMATQMGPNQINGQMSAQMLNQMNNHLGNQIGGSMGPQINNQMGNQMQGNINTSGPNQMMNPMGNQMHGQMPQTSAAMAGLGMQNQMGGPMAAQMSNQMHSQMGSPLNPSAMQNAMHITQRKGNDTAMMAQNGNFVGPRNATPNQFLRTSPSPNVQSPAGMGTGPPSNMMASSPVIGMAPSPGSQMGPAQPRSVGLSPGSSINTPGQAQPTPSPLAQNDDQAYLDKVRYLSKYIEPLSRMMKSVRAEGEKATKLRTLFDILSNPSKRNTTIETLRKCESVLEQLNISRYLDQNVAVSPSYIMPPSSSMGSLKENGLFRPLLDVMNTTLQSPMANHTLQRTFGATNQTLFGSDLKLLPPPKKRKVEETSSDIPELLQGEIARLDQRFKVSLDQTQQTGGNCIQLQCWLDDRHLPCVPPVSLTVPDDYPASPPRCMMGAHDYGATDFLKAVQNALEARMKKLPIRFTVSQLLHTWEMAVRQASAPTNTQPSTTTVLLGL